MDDKDTNNIAVIANDLKWVKQTLNEMSAKLTGLPLALESEGRRITNLDNLVAGILKDITKQSLDHEKNTLFRNKWETILGVFKWLVPLLGLSNILMIIRELIK